MTSPADLFDVNTLGRPCQIKMARSILEAPDFYEALSDLEFHVLGCEKTIQESARARRADRIQLRETCKRLVAKAAPVVVELDRVRTRLNILDGRTVSQASRDRLVA